MSFLYKIIAPTFSSSQQELLKIIAIVSMVISHAGVVLFPEFETIFYNIGRIAMPLFSFILVYNYIHHTKSVKNYVVRLIIVGIFSQAPFMMVFKQENFLSLNIMFTLAGGLMLIFSMDQISKLKNNITKFAIGYFSIMLFVFGGMFVDYIHLGFLLIISYWIWLRFPSHQTMFVVMAMTLLLNAPSGLVTVLSGGSFFILLCFVLSLNLSIKRVNKWFYYLIYPAHLLILHFLI